MKAYLTIIIVGFTTFFASAQLVNIESLRKDTDMVAFRNLGVKIRTQLVSKHFKLPSNINDIMGNSTKSSASEYKNP